MTRWAGYRLQSGSALRRERYHASNGVVHPLATGLVVAFRQLFEGCRLPARRPPVNDFSLLGSAGKRCPDWQSVLPAGTF